MAEQLNVDVGSEVESMCTKCKLVTVHVVSAIKDDKITKVMCKSCLSSHRYRPVDEETKAEIVQKAQERKLVAQKAARKRAATSAARKWENLLTKVQDEEQEQEQDPTEYSIQQTYETNQIINHTKFGKGVVVKIIDDKKVDIVFEDGIRTMAQNY
jgi:hypothetical protein